MKKLLLALVMFVAVSVFGGTPDKLDKETPFITSLIIVESSGDWDAVGDNGKSLGALQIQESVIKDVNRVYKTNYVHDDAFKRDKAIEICGLYLRYWGKQYIKRTKKQPTLEVYARIWNGGPKGYEKKATWEYWMKFIKVYKSIRSK